LGFRRQAIQGTAFAARRDDTPVLYQFVQPALQRSSGRALAQDRLNHLDARPVRVLLYRVHDHFALGG
jgi:hypothetical protein